jgi:hypothetical protein
MSQKIFPFFSTEIVSVILSAFKIGSISAISTGKLQAKRGGSCAEIISALMPVRHRGAAEGESEVLGVLRVPGGGGCVTVTEGVSSPRPPRYGFSPPSANGLRSSSLDTKKHSSAFRRYSFAVESRRPVVETK